MHSVKMPTIEYDLVQLNDIKMTTRRTRNGKVVIDELEIKDRPTKYTDRFGTSLCAIYGFSPTIYQYFDPCELVQRITERRPDDSRVRIAEEVDGDHRVCLAVSRPTRPFLSAYSTQVLLEKLGGEQMAYQNGCITSWHKPAVGGDSIFTIGVDDFENRFTMETPIDGYGSPSAYLAMINESTGAGWVGLSKAFRSQVQLGNKTDGDHFTTLERFIDSFNNEEGYIVMRQRFESALTSPASLDELYHLHRILSSQTMVSINTALGLDGKKKSVADKLWKLGGNIAKLYGIAAMDGLSAKRRRHIPVECTVYDLMNFATELSTHYATPEQARKLQTWLGTAIGQEYDLEGTLDADEDPEDLFGLAGGIKDEVVEVMEDGTEEVAGSETVGESQPGTSTAPKSQDTDEDTDEVDIAA